MTNPRPVRIGITAPSFVDDPETPLAVADVAEAGGLDGIFVFDHLFALGSERRRPALECMTLMGAIAARTRRIAIGSLVARVTLRPSASLVAALATIDRISDGRVIAGLGTGDAFTDDEDTAFGVCTPGAGITLNRRVELLRAGARAARGANLTTWIGGTSPKVRELALTEADGWNQWGGTAAQFAERALGLRSATQNLAVTENLELSWGGLVLVGESELDARRKAEALSEATNREIGATDPGYLIGGPERIAEALGEFVEAGADWLIVAPVDPVNLENSAIISERVAPLLRRVAQSNPK